jgi:putative ABC transport system substrate-binding protein
MVMGLTVPRLAIAVVMLLLVASVGAEAQESVTRIRVAYLGAESPSTNQHFLDAFREGLREHGYIDGQNITLDVRWADGRNERFPDLIRELVLLKPTAILAISTPAAKAAAKETTAVPVVFIAADPVGSGLLPALGRPKGNVTGLSITLGEDFAGKWLELLKETVPRMSKVSVLWNPTNPSNVGWMTSLRAAARTLGITLQPKEVRRPSSCYLTR